MEPHPDMYEDDRDTIDPDQLRVDRWMWRLERLVAFVFALTLVGGWAVFLGALVTP